MKKASSILLLFLLIFSVSALAQPKYVIGQKTAPKELTLPEWQQYKELQTNDPLVKISSFSIRFVLYDRDMEIVSTTSAISEEMYEGIELLSKMGEDPRDFYIDKVVATKNGKPIQLPQHKIHLVK